MGIKLKDILLEEYQLDLEIGDTILRGKFKNKPVVVKSFGKDDKGQPTINGKKMLSFRIKKLMPPKEGINEFKGKPIPMDTPNKLAYIDFKKYAYKNSSMFKKEMVKHGGDSSKMFRTLSALWFKWAYHKAKEFRHIKDDQKFGRALMVLMVQDNLIFDKKAWKKNNKITNIK